jgi:hypothetical protein
MVVVMFTQILSGLAASNPKEACSQRHATLGMGDLAQALLPMYKTSVKAGISYGVGHHGTRNSCIQQSIIMNRRACILAETSSVSEYQEMG